MNTSLAAKEQFEKEELALTDVTPLSINFILGENLLPLQKPFNCFFKRCFDVVLSFLAIVILFPLLFPVISLLIKLTSKGPVFFLQQRYKSKGILFTCIKFRTMRGVDEASATPISVDQRITKFGRFLRRHHLDELPQLINVFLGDMSIIGPRPHMISDTKRFEQMVPNYHFRYQVKPGITGLAQVHGYVGAVTSAEKLEQRIGKDTEYVKKWSPALDARIAVQTIVRMIIVAKQ